MFNIKSVVIWWRSSPLVFVCFAWLLVGQVVMLCVSSYGAKDSYATGVLYFVAQLFPTIQKTDSRYVFSPLVASNYLTAMACLFPILMASMMKIPVRYFFNLSAEKLDKYRWPLVIFLSVLGLYGMHFRWDDGFFVRLLCSFSYGFSIAGCILFLFVSYAFRAAVGLVVAK